MNAASAISRVVLILISIAAAFAIAYYLQGGKITIGTASDSMESSTSASATLDRSQAHAGQNRGEKARSADASSSRRESPIRKFDGAGRIEVGDPFYRTTSPEDAEWFNRNWYPTTDMTEAARALAGNAELPEDLIPRSAWDLAQATLLMGNPDLGDDARTVLEHGAQLGSGFALEALGSYYEVHGEREEAQAYFLASVMRGDWRNSHRWGTGNPEFDRQTMMRALVIFQQIDQARAQRGLPPLTSNLRPGFGDVSERRGPPTGG